MTCILSKTLEALDEKLRMLKQNINDMNKQVQDCKTDMKEVKRAKVEHPYLEAKKYLLP